MRLHCLCITHPSAFEVLNQLVMDVHLRLPFLFPNLFLGNDPFVATSSDSHTHTQYRRALQISFPYKGNEFHQSQQAHCAQHYEVGGHKQTQHPQH